jgi:hypothetical protein
LPETSEVAVVAFDSEVTDATSGFVSAARAAAAVAALGPTLAGTDLRGALAAARRLLDRRPGEVLLFTDEAGPGVVAGAEDELRRLAGDGAAVIPFAVGPDEPRNTWIEWIQWSEGGDGGQVALALGHRGPPEEIPCDVYLPDGQTISVFIAVGASGGTKRVSVPEGASGGVGTVSCEDRWLVEDNVAGWHLPRVAASRVLVVDGDPGESATRSEVYFLERALAPFGGNRADVGVEVVPPAGIGVLGEGRHRVAWLANVADPRPWGRVLSEFVHGGGMLVVSGGDNVRPDHWNAAVAPILPAPLRRVVDLASAGEVGVALQPPIDVDPVLEPFRDAGSAGFGRVRARAALGFEGTVAADTRAALRWEGGLPALMVRPVGRGSVVVWTSTVDLGWSDLALQAVFVPMVQGIVRAAGAAVGEGPAVASAHTGTRVALPARDVLDDLQLVDPEGRIGAARVEAGRIVVLPDRPGRWSVDEVGGAPIAELAVRVDPSESDVAVAESVQEVEARIDPMAAGRVEDLAPWAWLASGAALGAAALLAVRQVRAS